MSYWGMGIAHSDQFCEVYENFMQEYDKGKEVKDISKNILSQYLDLFDINDGVLHDVYFGLAKAEWICCEQSQEVLNKVRYIIENNLNISFLRELEVDENDLKLRKRNLLNFLKMLETPRSNPRKRKIKKRKFPPLENGDCFAYKTESGYRIGVVIEKRDDVIYTCILRGDYPSFDINFMDEVIAGIAGFGIKDFLPESKIQKIGSVKIYECINDMAPRIHFKIPWMYGSRNTFFKDFPDRPSTKLSDLIIPK